MKTQIDLTKLSLEEKKKLFRSLLESVPWTIHPKLIEKKNQN